MPAWPSLMTWMASAMRFERKAVGDHGAGVELAGAEEAAHLVPGLVHLAAGDAVERESLEDHVAGEVHLGGAARRAEQVHPPAEARRGEGLRMTARMAAHLADQVHAVAAGQLADPGKHVVGARD